MISLIFFCIYFGFTNCLAGLQVFPTRLLITDQKKFAQISLRHTGTEPENYNIALIFFRMKPNGVLEQIETPTESDRDAFKYIRFSPKTVKLLPNVEQILRVMSINVQGLPEGDYRAHLQFLPEGKKQSESAVGGDSEKSVRMRIEARVAVAVPVVLRRGRTDMVASLSSPKLTKSTDGKPQISLNIHRGGSSFLFGDFFLWLTQKGALQPVQAGLLRGVASYLTDRTVDIPITGVSAKDLETGTIKVEYKSSFEEGEKLLSSLELTPNASTH